MESAFVAANVSAAITTALGALGLFAPDRAAAFTSIAPVGPNGRSEIRATYGGLFAALGICLILSQSGAMFFIVGVAWVGAAAGRVWSVLIDGNRLPKNLGAIGFELALGLLLLAPGWAAA